MSRSALIRIVVVLVIALLAWGGLALTRGPVSDRSDTLTLPRIDTATVDTITLTKHADTTVLARDAGGKWRVAGYPAAANAVSGLLQALTDTTRRSELVSESRALHAQMGVTPDSGERVRIASRGRSLLDLTTGKHTSNGGGIYVRLTDKDPVYALTGSLANALARAPDAWRDKHIASVLLDSIAAVEVRRAPASYTLRRSGQHWTLASGEALDSAAVATLLTQYHDLSASGFATRAQSDSARFGRHAARVKLLTASGAPLVALAFDSTAGGVWARADTGGVVFRLDAWRLRDLAPPKSQLLKRKAK